MSNAEARGYQPPSVEDGDEEVCGALRTSANVAVKRDLVSESDNPTPLYPRYDGTDSGYASKAPTVSSTMSSSQRRRATDLKVDTAIMIERERQPYAMTATPRENRPTSTMRLPQEMAAKETSKPVAKPFCHKSGICWVCDGWGFHFDPKNPPKDLPKRELSKTITPATRVSQQPTKPAPPQVKTEDFIRPLSRRMTSNQGQRHSMYITGTPIQTPVQTPMHTPYTQYPAMHHGWNVATPTQGITYMSYPFVTPATPVTYMQPAPPPPQQQQQQQQQRQYFPDYPPSFEEYSTHPTKVSRRTSMVVQERPLLEKRPSRTNTVAERPVSRESRPQMTHRPIKSVDLDRIAMPPPKLPHASTIAAARPRPGRSNTYHPTVSANRHSYRGASSDEEDSETDIDPRALVSYKEPPSPRRPTSSRQAPSAWKALQPPQEGNDRPHLPPKASSYNEGGQMVQIAAIPRRRTTDSIPGSTIEKKEADAEAYMRKRSSGQFVELTADNLKSFKNAVPRHVSDQRSDSGSAVSNATRQSSSKDSSSGRGRAPTSSASALGQSKGTSVNVNIAGLNFNITDDGNVHGGPPVKLDVAGITISMNNRDKENIDHRRPGQKALERAPSTSSKTSRRSLTSSSMVLASSSQRRDMDDVRAIESGNSHRREYARPNSYIDDEGDEVLERETYGRSSARSSKQPSRNSSSIRRSVGDDIPVRPHVQSHRSSVDSSLRRDETIM